MTQLYIFLQRYFSTALLYPVLMFPLYISLLMIWRTSIRQRVIHPKTRALMIGEVYVMMMWVTVRLFQQTLLYRNDYLMRFSGYFISVPLVVLPLIGLYTSLHIGKNRGYTMPRALYILIVPAVLLVTFMATNDLHNLVFSPEPDAPLTFHAKAGINLILLWTLSFKLLSIAVIARKGKEVTKGTLKALVPVFMTLMMFVVGIPYFMSGFTVSWEPVELTVSMFFLEILVWETSISVGMFPVNTYYKEAFESSSIAMQITDKDGKPITVSQGTEPISEELFKDLLRSETHSITDIRPGIEICIHSIGNEYVIWQEDISRIRNAIERLNTSNAELKHENELLRKEIAINSESGRFNIKNKLYEQLSGEVSGQITLMNSLIGKCRTADDKTAYLGQIALIGTYIKRRSNMRLNSAENKMTSREEMMTALRDISKCLELLGTNSAHEYLSTKDIDTEYAVFILDTLEQVFERLSFDIDEIYLSVGADESFVLEITNESRPFEATDTILINEKFETVTVISDKKTRIRISEKYV